MVRTAHTAGFSSEEVDIRFAVIPSTGFMRRGQGAMAMVEALHSVTEAPSCVTEDW